MATSSTPRAGAAALLSALVPGLGQFYNRQWGKGAAFLLGIVVLDGILSVSADMLMLLRTAGPEMQVVHAGSLLLRMVPLVAVGLWSIVDAARTAKSLHPESATPLSPSSPRM